MEIGKLAASTTTQKQILRAVQVLQLGIFDATAKQLEDFLDSTIKVWNSNNGKGGTIIPPMTVKQLILLNGDEYKLQEAYNQATGVDTSTYTLIVSFEICDEGSLNPTIYVNFTNASTAVVTLSAVDVLGTTPVKMRLYNSMNILSPQELPKNSICILSSSDIVNLQKNNDVMSENEILTHSNCVFENAMENIHPCYYDAQLTTPALAPNALYQAMAEGMAMGYGGDTILIETGEDSFMVYPDSGGCPVIYCQKSLTEIAQQVLDALTVSGSQNNVDSQEFAGAVAAVGEIAAAQKLPTSQTQFVANQVVAKLPSYIIGKALGIKNLNLSSETVKTTGVNKVLTAKS